ncbi:MAG: hypothetical protein EBZ75_14455, partial [Oxalobacteraceae bacterium]|nr:hypothetical protein [Oxalobacteraceae bacterium]
MAYPNHTARALTLAQQKGLLRASDLEAIGVSRVVLTRLASSGALERVSRGLYRLARAAGSEHEGLLTI